MVCFIWNTKKHWKRKPNTNARLYCENKETIKILELGAGSSGIASIALAKAIINITKEYKLFLKLTDGEETNIPFL